MAKAEYRSAIRSRRLINTALTELLQQKPLEKITVTDVVNRAQINRGTFYAHYRDIPDLINRMVEQMFARIREGMANMENPREAAPGLLLGQIQKQIEENMAFCKVMISRNHAMMESQLCSVLQDYLLKGYGQNEDCELKLRFCAGGLTKLYQDWLTGKIVCSMEEFNRKAENMIRCFLPEASPAGS